MQRSQLVAGGLAALGVPAVLREPARAAQFVYRFAHGVPVDYPTHVRLVQMAAAVKAETNGRMEIQIFPNNVLGAQTSMLAQVRLGSIQFVNLGNSSWASVVPVAAIDGVGFAFTSSAQAFAAVDGALGAYIRKEFAARNLHVFERCFDQGLRQITSSTKPIRRADDFTGFKLRTPPAAMVIDLFKTLGASPVAIDVNELYTALQTHVVDGQELALQQIESFRYYEVQKFLSMTNHMWSGSWVVANGDAWNALPPDVQNVVSRNVNKYVGLERADIAIMNVSAGDKLRRQGLTFNPTDAVSMRSRLGPFYAKWKSELGATPWGLLEDAVGKLG